jgi:pimeloyl-ACP methyl ester carboxylesterase
MTMHRTALAFVLCNSLFAALAPAQTSEPPGAFATLPGRRLWYVDTGGTGTPVVLLHAASGSILMWERQLPSLRAAGYRVIAFDRVGWGRSELDAGAAPGTAADDLQGLLALLRVDRFHLVGTAAGGFVAFDYALSFPERLRSLTVANSIGGIQDEDYVALGRRLRSTCARWDRRTGRPMPPGRPDGPSSRGRAGWRRRCRRHRPSKTASRSRVWRRSGCRRC